MLRRLLAPKPPVVALALASALGIAATAGILALAAPTQARAKDCVSCLQVVPECPSGYVVVLQTCERCAHCALRQPRVGTRSTRTTSSFGPGPVKKEKKKPVSAPPPAKRDPHRR